MNYGADGPATLTLKHRSALRRKKIYERLRQAASAGEYCPSNAELGALVGYMDSGSVTTALNRMCKEGIIALAHHMGCRQIIFPDGLSTQRPEIWDKDRAQPKVPVRFIVEQAAAIWNRCAKDIIGKSRFTEFMLPRHAVTAVASEQGWSAPHIARLTGRREHSTILHGIKRAKAIAERDDVFAARFDRLRGAVAAEKQRMTEAREAEREREFQSCIKRAA